VISDATLATVGASTNNGVLFFFNGVYCRALIELQCRQNRSYTEVRLIWSQFDSCRVLEAIFGVRRLRVLSDLAVGESGVLVALDLPPGVQNHLMYMGFVPDARVKVLHRAPVGDPTVYSVDGMEIALRRETAKSIRVQALKAVETVAAIADKPRETVEQVQEPVHEFAR
jgi:ferrous iron transport protein A